MSPCHQFPDRQTPSSPANNGSKAVFQTQMRLMVIPKHSAGSRNMSSGAKKAPVNPVICKIRQIDCRFLSQSRASPAHHLAVAVAHHFNSAYAPSPPDSCQRPSTTFLALFDELIARRTEEKPRPLEALAKGSAHVYWLRGTDSCKRQNVIRGFCKA